MKKYIKPTVKIESLIPESNLAYGEEYPLSVPGSWMNDIKMQDPAYRSSETQTTSSNPES